jgi:hypothetical protein
MSLLIQVIREVVKMEPKEHSLFKKIFSAFICQEDIVVDVQQTIHCLYCTSLGQVFSTFIPIPLFRLPSKLYQRIARQSLKEQYEAKVFQELNAQENCS